MCHLETLTSLYWHHVPFPSFCFFYCSNASPENARWWSPLGTGTGLLVGLTRNAGKFITASIPIPLLPSLLTHSQWLTDVGIPKLRFFAGKTIRYTPELPCRSGWVCNFTWSYIFIWRSPALPCFPTLPPPLVSPGILTLINHLHSNPWLRVSAWKEIT